MSDREWILFLDDIKRCIDLIIIYTNGMTKQKFLDDQKTFDAVMRNLEIIGEAAKHLPYDIKKKYKNVEWKKIAGLRDIVIHEYFGVDDEIIWDIIKNKIPELKLKIYKIEY